MGIVRTVFHFLTLGIVDSNAEFERKNTYCHFSDSLTRDDFNSLAINVAKPIKRLTVSTHNEFVIGQVRTTSGINTWTFKLDFNDYGRITGNYWFRDHGNYDSQIPQSYANQLRNAIIEHLRTH